MRPQGSAELQSLCNAIDQLQCEFVESQEINGWTDDAHDFDERLGLINARLFHLNEGEKEWDETHPHNIAGIYFPRSLPHLELLYKMFTSYLNRRRRQETARIARENTDEANS